jgi:hypothetical protein
MSVAAEHGKVEYAYKDVKVPKETGIDISW